MTHFFWERLMRLATCERVRRWLRQQFLGGNDDPMRAVYGIPDLCDVGSNNGETSIFDGHDALPDQAGGSAIGLSATDAHGRSPGR